MNKTRVIRNLQRCRSATMSSHYGENHEPITRTYQLIHALAKVHGNSMKSWSLAAYLVIECPNWDLSTRAIWRKHGRLIRAVLQKDILERRDAYKRIRKQQTGTPRAS